MTTTTGSHLAMHRAALIAGLGLLLMAVLAGLATFGVLERVVTDGDASRTTNDILAAFGSFRLAILALFGVAVLDVVVAWALWAFFDRVHHTVAVLAAWCRGLYAVVFAVAISQLVAAARLLADGRLRGQADLQLQSEVLTQIDRAVRRHMESRTGPVRDPPPAHRLAGIQVGLRPSIHRRPRLDRRHRLPRRQLWRAALRDVHLRARLFHLHRRGRVDDLAAGVRCPQAAQRRRQFR
jgi:hypothetical protein